MSDGRKKRRRRRKHIRVFIGGMCIACGAQVQEGGLGFGFGSWLGWEK